MTTAPLRLSAELLPAHVDLAPYAGRLFLKVSDVARITGTDPRTIRRAIDLDQIPALRLGDATIRIPAAPFWALIGTTPELLRPHDAGGVGGVDDGDASEAGPVPGADPEDVPLAKGDRRDDQHARPDHSPSSTSAGP